MSMQARAVQGNQLRFSREEKAAFSRWNIGRIRQLIQARNDPLLLKEVPPVFINLDLTWKCNYDCQLCVDGGAVGREKIETPELDWEITKNIIEYAKANALRGFVIQGGEVLSYPEIDAFLDTCAESGIALSLVSNGSLLGNHLDALVHAFSTPGSSLRVSVNADEANYQRLTRGGVPLRRVLGNIEQLAKRGRGVAVSTVVYGKAVPRFSNVDQLDGIINSVCQAGAKGLFFIPARDPLTKVMYPLESEERGELRELTGNRGGMNVRMAALFDEMPARSQNKDYAPCPSSLLRTLVGSDGSVFVCTDHRDPRKKKAILGKVSREMPFASAWHSEERVLAQQRFNPAEMCRDITCMRYGLNAAFDSVRWGFNKFGAASLPDYLIRESDSIFF